MCRRVRGVVSAVAVAALLVTGCSDGDGSAADGDIEPIEVEPEEPDPEQASDVESEAAPEPAPEPEPASEPEPDAAEPDDPFAFDDPAEIDAAYVDSVMAALLAVESEVLNDVLESDPAEGLTMADSSRLRAVLAGPRLVDAAEQMQQFATDEGIRTVFLPAVERTGLAWTTREVASTSQDCVVAIGVNDVSGVATEPYPADESSVAVLSRMTDSEWAEREGFNPTQWRIHDLQRLVYSDSGAAVPEDEWSGLDFEAFLDIPCELAS